MKIRLPDRHDLLVLVGAAVVIAGAYQVAPWLAYILAGAALVYVGVVTERP